MPRPQAQAAAASPGALVATALLDFQQYPGKYSVFHQEPALLFASIPLVLQFAAGKSASASEPQLERAACFFVRTALLYPGADHYALLGLRRDSSADALKQHYRLLMRLVHPDFSENLGSTWPADAAARLNLACAVLSSEPRRARHDKQMDAASLPRPPRSRAARPASLKAPRAKLGSADPRFLLKLLAGGFGVAGAAGVGALIFINDADKDSLVQKPLHAAVAALAAPQAAPPVTAAPGTAEVTATFVAAAPPGSRTRRVPAAPRSLAASPSGAPAAPYAAPNAAASLPPIAAAAASYDRSANATVPPLPAAPAGPTVQAPAGVTSAATPNPGLTLLEAQPLLATLLQHVQRGQGEQLLTLLDREARNAPAALALSRRLDAIAEGARPIKLSHVEFRAEPAEGRLIVTGRMQLHTGEPGSGGPAKTLSMRAEFAARQGKVVMTALAGLGGN